MFDLLMEIWKCLDNMCTCTDYTVFKVTLCTTEDEWHLKN